MADSTETWTPGKVFTRITNRIPDVPADNYPIFRRACESYLTETEQARVEAAYLFAAERHADQRRRSGESYINHPVETALILADQLRMDDDVLCAALLHDTVEDTPITLEDVTEVFGSTVAELVDGVTKLTSIEVDSMDAKQAFNLRKMFLAMSKDIRILIIKLADRLHNMRTLAALTSDRRAFKARETMDVYAPLADRLGISSIKWELDDLSFFYLYPEEYQRVARMVQDTREQREQATSMIIRKLKEELTRAGIENFQIRGRPKHLWSIYLKMKKKDKEFPDIYDLTALRVITETVGECYSALGAVHSLWHPLPGRFKDYIATPKPNGYQSLHTTVIGLEARPIEIQIRTVKMHEQAEYGIAAHWLYKQHGGSKGKKALHDEAVDAQVNWIRKSLDWTVDSDIVDPREYLHDLRRDLFEDEIFVFTPKGEVMSLRAGSTPLDFAYAVHTEVGNHCVGVKVNGVVVPLTTVLETGDRLEVLTNNNSHPSRDWITICKTPHARAKIRKYFTEASKFDDAEQGRIELGRELRKRGYGISTQRSQKALASVAQELSFRAVKDMLATIGTGRTSVKHVANKVVAVLTKDTPAAFAAAQAAARKDNEIKRALAAGAEESYQQRLKRSSARDKRKRGNCGVVVKGDSDLLVHLAHCCNPVAGDDIVGFITRGRGVSVHRSDCPNVKSLMDNPERIIEVQWDASGATEFQVEIVVEAIDRMGLLKDITVALGDAGSNILSAATQTSSSGMARLRFLVAISDASLLDSLLASVSHVSSVFDARRIMPGEGSRQMKRRL